MTDRKIRIDSIYNADGERRCYACRDYLPPDSFGKGAREADGLARICKPCGRKKSAAANARRTPEQEKAWRERRLADPAARERLRAAQKSWADRNPDKVRDMALTAQLKHKYGLTRAGFADLLAGQGGVCAVCSGPPAPGKRLVVDHDHATNEVRGLLCGPCNIMLGHSGDRPEVLAAGAAYLTRRSS